MHTPLRTQKMSSILGRCAVGLRGGQGKKKKWTIKRKLNPTNSTVYNEEGGGALGRHGKEGQTDKKTGEAAFLEKNNFGPAL